MADQEQNAGSMGISCPKAPDEEIMRMLIRANQFLNHAMEHSLSNNEFDTMISIHNLDNAIEYVLRILIRHFDVEAEAGKAVESPEIDQLIGILSRYFADHGCPSLPCVQEVKLIRKQRNMVQHAITNPAADLKLYLRQGERFFERVLDRYFGIQRADLCFSTLIEDEFTKSLIKQTEERLAESKYLESIVAARDAFDYSIFQNPLYQTEKLWNPPAIVEAKNSFTELPLFLSNMYDLLSMSVLDVDMPKYNRFREYIEYIPSEYRKDNLGHAVKQQPWKKEDAEFCYLFVCETILRWQSFNVECVDVPDPFDHEYTHEEKIEGIRIDTIFVNKSCLYVNEKGTARLFYLNSKEEVDIILHCANKGYVRSYHRTLVDDSVKFEANDILYVKSIDYKLVMNNPETWQVYILYESVPFTNQDLLKVEQKDIDALPDSDDIAKTAASYLPLESYEAAKELSEELKRSGIDSESYFSSKLIKMLTGEQSNE